MEEVRPEDGEGNSSFQLTQEKQSKYVNLTTKSFDLYLNTGSRADKEVKMASIVDDVNAYSYLIPLELPSKNFPLNG
ncbi:hypothetical protein Tco_0012190 [Tanacetum coccineum]